MKSIKSVLLGSTIVASTLFFSVGAMNSFNLNKDVVLKNDLNIKFAKRLDEMTGEFVVGRMAASIPRNVNFDKPVKKELKEKISVKEVSNDNFVAEIATPEPAVRDTDDLILTGGLYDKKPLKDGVDFNGNAKVINGVIEEIYVSLPDGKEFILNTNEQMVGNVFQYEDTQTREIRSGLFYEIKEGHYMLTLTDDTNFSGLRLEFKAQGNAVIANKNPDAKANWDMNEYNETEEEFAENEEELEEESEYEDAPVATSQDNNFSFKFAMN